MQKEFLSLHKETTWEETTTNKQWSQTDKLRLWVASQLIQSIDNKFDRYNMTILCMSSRDEEWVHDNGWWRHIDKRRRYDMRRQPKQTSWDSEGQQAATTILNSQTTSHDNFKSKRGEETTQSRQDVKSLLTRSQDNNTASHDNITINKPRQQDEQGNEPMRHTKVDEMTCKADKWRHHAKTMKSQEVEMR